MLESVPQTLPAQERDQVTPFALLAERSFVTVAVKFVIELPPGIMPEGVCGVTLTVILDVIVMFADPDKFSLESVAVITTVLKTPLPGNGFGTVAGAV